MIHTLYSYLPQDRLRALQQGQSLPDRTHGAALFADISGFTPLTESLTQQLGPRRGIEALTQQINAVYDALITQIEAYGGSVISFAGDAITCWFDDDTGVKAITAALALQACMMTFPQLGLKVAVTSGPARRFVVGDRVIQQLDTLAGATVARLATAEHLARRGEVVVDTPTAQMLAQMVVVEEWRTAVHGECFAVVQGMKVTAVPVAVEDSNFLDLDALRSWILPAIWEREQSGHTLFLTELRSAVVLFVRFTGLDYDEDEQAGDKLHTFISRVQNILDRYQGVLLQLNMGDKGSSLYAAFGVLLAHEDDTRRAILASLELQSLPSKLRFLESIQIGISRGFVLAGLYGGSTRRTYGVLGDEVNVAARLMTAVQGNEILVSGHVQSQVAELFNFEPHPPLLLKGKAEPLPVFAITGQRTQRAIRLEEPRYALPMMGRQAELALIEEKFQSVLQGRGQVIGIVAEAGMGKSRLVAEAIRLAHQRGFVGYGGVCESSGTLTPYLVWKKIWQAFFDVNPTASLRRQLRQLEDEVEEHTPVRVPTVPVLSILLDIPIAENDFTHTLEPKDRRNVLTAVLLECLQSAASQGPHLFVLEDLHWVDALSHDLLETLATASENLPICFVLAYRPPNPLRYQAPRVENLPYFTRITLQQLTDLEAEALIRAKLAQRFPARGHSLPSTFVAALNGRAEGNPFYIEELLNYLHDHGLNPYQVKTVDTLELPASLHALILSRMDQLSEAQKVALKTASVIGCVFSLAWLHGYYPELGEVDGLKADLAELAKLDLTPLDTPEPDPTYLFKHIVTREVAYESLPHTTRTQLHEQLAQFIETLEGQHLDLLVFHYGLSNNKAKQCEYLQKAGDAAQASYAPKTALDYYARLLPLLTDLQTQLDLQLKMVDSHMGLGDFLTARTMLNNILHSTTDLATCAAAFTRLGEMAGGIDGDYREANTLLLKALNLARESMNQTIVTDILYGLSVTNWELGNSEIVPLYLNESLKLARELKDTPRILAALKVMGVTSPHLDAKEQILKEVHTLALAVGERKWVIHAVTSLGAVAYSRGRWAEARDLYQQALILVRELGNRYTGLFLLNLASANIPLGNLDEARAQLREGLKMAYESDYLRLVMTAVYFFADLTAVEGDTARGLALMGMCQRHPIFSSEAKQEIEAILARWHLDEAVVEAGLADGAKLDWETTVAEIVRELAAVA